MGKKRYNSSKLWLLALLIAYAMIALISLSIGRYSVTMPEIVRILLSTIFNIDKTWSAQAEATILSIRLPRIIASFIIGGGLALAGLVMQTVFKNPMVSPDVLGTSGASGFGASLAIILHLPTALISPIAFIFGLSSIILVYLVASRVKSNQLLGLVLGGMMISSIFSSLLSFVKLMADPEDALPSITYFLMGSLSGCSLDDVKMVFLPMASASIILFLLSWRVNTLSLSEDEAISMGINPKSLRAIVLLLAVLLVALSVAISGVIGWIGLIVPHLARMLMGCDTRKTFPASFMLGAIFLTLSDTLSRTISFSEIPIGIITSLVGAPFFLYLIIREGRRSNA